MTATFELAIFLPISPHEYFLINFSTWKLFYTFNNRTLCYKFVISEKLKRLEALKLRKTFEFTKRLLRRTFAMSNFVGIDVIHSYNINVFYKFMFCFYENVTVNKCVLTHIT